MFNVYSHEISYTRTNKAGVMAGIPQVCTFGVASEADGKRRFAQLVTDNPEAVFNNFEVRKK